MVQESQESRGVDEDVGTDGKEKVRSEVEGEKVEGQEAGRRRRTKQNSESSDKSLDDAANGKRRTVAA